MNWFQTFYHYYWICYGSNSNLFKGIWTAGQVLEVVLAKPQTDKKFEGSYPHNAGPHPNHLPHPGYGGFAGNPYGSLGAGYGVATSFQQVLAWIFVSWHSFFTGWIPSHGFAHINSQWYTVGVQCQQECIWSQWFYQMVGLVMFCKLPLNSKVVFTF